MIKNTQLTKEFVIMNLELFKLDLFIKLLIFLLLMAVDLLIFDSWLTKWTIRLDDLFYVIVVMSDNNSRALTYSPSLVELVQILLIKCPLRNNHNTQPATENLLVTEPFVRFLFFILTSPRKIQITKLARRLTKRKRKPLSCSRKEGGHLREQRFAWLPTDGETHSSSLKKTFASSRSNSSFLSFFLFLLPPLPLSFARR